eukprot:3944861-Pleurochrysis_carterae.AAC.1
MPPGRRLRCRPRRVRPPRAVRIARGALVWPRTRGAWRPTRPAPPRRSPDVARVCGGPFTTNALLPLSRSRGRAGRCAVTPL